jgi:hypothetical protein
MMQCKSSDPKVGSADPSSTTATTRGNHHMTKLKLRALPYAGTLVAIASIAGYYGGK